MCVLQDAYISQFQCLPLTWPQSWRHFRSAQGPMSLEFLYLLRGSLFTDAADVLDRVAHKDIDFELL
jgi:hypothetical protein